MYAPQEPQDDSFLGIVDIAVSDGSSHMLGDGIFVAETLRVVQHNSGHIMSDIARGTLARLSIATPQRVRTAHAQAKGTTDAYKPTIQARSVWVWLRARLGFGTIVLSPKRRLDISLPYIQATQARLASQIGMLGFLSSGSVLVSGVSARARHIWFAPVSARSCVAHEFVVPQSASVWFARLSKSVPPQMLDLRVPVELLAADTLDLSSTALPRLPSRERFSDIFLPERSWASRSVSWLSGVFRALVLGSFWRVAFRTLGMLALVLSIGVWQAYSGAAALYSLKNFSSIAASARSVASAERSFDIAAVLLWPLALAPASSVPASAYQGILASRAISASLGQLSTVAFDAYGQLSALGAFSGGRSPKDILSDPNFSATDFLASRRSQMLAIETELTQALTHLKNIGILPGELGTHQAKLTSATADLSSLVTGLHLINTHFDAVLDALGAPLPHRYLILNQNRDEIRASGGFPGSIIEFTLYRGRLTKYRTRDIYDVDWKLYPDRVAPPPGIDRLTDNFGLRDANYFPYLADNLPTINRFLERSWGQTVDTVIAINQWLAEAVLSKVGAVPLAEYRSVVTADTFTTIISTLVEAKVQPYKQLAAGEWQTPKGVLFDFASALEKAISDRKMWEAVARVVLAQVQAGEVLVASSHADVQTLLDDTHLYGTWRQNTGNYIYPVFTSISGNKSDRTTERAITTTTKNLGDCRVQTQVTLASQQTFGATEEHTVRAILSRAGFSGKYVEEMLAIQGKGDNKQFVRFFVPLGAKLTTNNPSVTSRQTVDGTEFAFYLTTPFGGTVASKTLTYEAQTQTCTTKEPTIYHQPGLRPFVNPSSIK